MTVTVTARPSIAPVGPRSRARPGTTSTLQRASSCPKVSSPAASIDAVRTQSADVVREDSLRIDAAMIRTFPGQLRAAQAVFELTGGLHAAALFDGASGEMLVLREDIGRHNAVDKVVGWALKEDRLPLRGSVLMVSGRASFELTQKAGMTLVGFVRGSSMVSCAGEERVTRPDGDARKPPPRHGSGRPLRCSATELRPGSGCGAD